MADYVIITDTGCDISNEILQSWNVECVHLSFHKEGASETLYQKDFPIAEFYENMKTGVIYQTSAANIDDFTKAFEPYLAAGNDILYVGFSSGLSSTVGTGNMTGLELMEKYPDRKVITVDTLAASAGQGFLVKLAVDKHAAGASIEEVAEYLENNKLNMCHWFTVDDLVYLKRGGRCSAAAAFMGSILNIKPVLHVDDEGHLIPLFKVRGRKKSLASILEQFKNLALDLKCDYMISHASCLEDAKALEQMIIDAGGKECSLITDVGAVIGSHSGPGTLALFFLGKNR